MQKLSVQTRIATVTATGERFIVIHRDFTFRKVQCWGNVIRHDGVANAAFDGTKVFTDNEVTVSDATIDGRMLDALFNQTRGSSMYRAHLLSGDKEVFKSKGVWTIRNAPKSSTRHESHKCPRCNQHMRLRRGPNGGNFLGAPRARRLAATSPSRWTASGLTRTATSRRRRRLRSASHA